MCDDMIRRRVDLRSNTPCHVLFKSYSGLTVFKILLIRKQVILLPLLLPAIFIGRIEQVFYEHAVTVTRKLKTL